VPELPEVETVRRGVAARALDRRILSVHVGRERSVRRTGPGPVVAGLTGARIVGANRLGKWLLFPLDNGGEMAVHLRMSGRLLVTAPSVSRPAHTHVVLVLADGADDAGSPTELRFVDPRTFGEVVVYDASERAAVLPEVARLGPDPLLHGVDRMRLGEHLAGTARAVKAVLLDQGVIAGVGNIYADEILHRCRIAPTRPARAVSHREVDALARITVEVLERAVAAGGSTLADTQYTGIDGEAGRYQEAHRVYARTGEPCLTCGKGPVMRSVVAGRSSHWCPHCQT
jgi:formamidopyrimidine-DNA glycosylase